MWDYDRSGLFMRSLLITLHTSHLPLRFYYLKFDIPTMYEGREDQALNAHHCIPSASQLRVVTTPLLLLSAMLKFLPVNYYIFHKLTVEVPTQQGKRTHCRGKDEP